MNVLAWQVTIVGILAATVCCTSLLGDDGSVSTLVNTLHVFACALWLGTSAWASGFQGVIMLQVLPRHAFGVAQGAVFPALFLYADLCTGIAMATFLYQHPPATLVTSNDWIQASVLASALACALVNSAWLVPQSIRLMVACHKIEKDAGLGQAVGDPDRSKLKGNARYQSLRKSFLVYHIISQLTAALSCVCMAYRVAHLASKFASI